MSDVDHKRFMDPALAYMLWFEFLWRAKESDDPAVLAALEANDDNYEAWGLVPYEDFFTWWRKHDFLFEEMDVVRELNPGELPEYDQSLILEIPLTKSFSRVMQDVSSVIQAAYEERGKSGRKFGRRSRALFHLSEGAEPKLLELHQSGIVYDIWKENKLLSQDALLKEVQQHYLSGYLDSQTEVIPKEFQPRNVVNVLDDDARMRKNVIRALERAKRVILNVANGEFPGKYST